MADRIVDKAADVRWVVFGVALLILGTILRLL
jgi:hypothetical protein